jgi:hypothetical protein
MATFSSGVKCFRSFLIRSLRYLNGRTLSPFPTVLVQPEMERGRSPLVRIPPFRAGIFKASGSTDPMRIWKPRKEQVPALPFIVSMSPPGYPSAWLRPRRARFQAFRKAVEQAAKEP